MQIEEILIIKNDDISYAIPTGDIEQILRVPELTPLALSPKEVLGLCAVGGNIATMIDFNLLLGVGAVDRGASGSRLLTLTEGFSHIALLVPEVIDTVLVEEDKIDYIDDPEDAVCAICKNGDDIVQILDLRRMLGAVSMPKHIVRDIKESSSAAGDGETRRQDSCERYLLFKMASERYAIDIDCLREIIALPESFTEIAGSNMEICGMMSLRDELLTVADLRRYYGFEASRRDSNRILVVQDGAKTLGLIIDEIIDIRDYGREQIAVMPENFQDQKLSGIIHDKEKLVSLIAKSILEKLFKENEKFIISNSEDTAAAESDRVMEVVVFKLGEEEYAINIEEVAEIIDTTSVTPVAGSSELVEGVINIRGQVVPIGSLHKRLGINKGNHKEQKIIVCHVGKNRIGFFVGSVSDIMDVRRNELRKEDNNGGLFSNVLHLDLGRRLVLLFNMDVLLSEKGAA